MDKGSADLFKTKIAKLDNDRDDVIINFIDKSKRSMLFVKIEILVIFINYFKRHITRAVKKYGLTNLKCAIYFSNITKEMDVEYFKESFELIHEYNSIHPHVIDSDKLVDAMDHYYTRSFDFLILEIEKETGIKFIWKKTSGTFLFGTPSIIEQSSSLFNTHNHTCC